VVSRQVLILVDGMRGSGPRWLAFTRWHWDVFALFVVIGGATGRLA
jgi:hypothetical protein